MDRPAPARVTPSSPATALALNVGAAALFLGLAPLAKKGALDAGAEPLTLAVVKTSLAALVVGLVLVGRGGLADVARLDRGLWGRLLFVGAAGTAAVTLLSTFALTRTTATNAGLFQAMYPVATALCARALLGERLRPAAYAVIALMSGGLLLMSAPDGEPRIDLAFWLLAATLPLIGLADVYAKRSLDDVPPSVVTGGRVVLGALALLPAVAFLEGTDWWSLLAAWPWVAAAALCTVAGVHFLYRAMHTEKASLAAAFIALAPVVTVLAEFGLLGTTFEPLQLTGVAVVVTGAAALAFLRR